MFCVRGLLDAQTPQQGAPTVISSPPRDFGPNAPPTTYFADPDVLAIDPAFNALIQGNTPILRVWTGALWTEGPAWNAQGRYLLWSDIPNNRQYRWLDDDGHVSVFRTPDPNGLAFSPDFRRLYVTSTGKGPGDTGDGGKGEVYVFDVGADNKVSNRRLFTNCTVDGVKCGPDGVRCDVDGNVWLSSNAGRTLGYSGVTVWNPAGTLLGRIRLPEVCANIAFGGKNRNRLFMAASQSIYALYVGTQGA